MSTQRDIEEFERLLPSLPDGMRTCAYVGARELDHVVSIRERWKDCWVETVDNDACILVPNLRHDISDPFPRHFDLIVCPYVLMYVPQPLAALRNLLDAADKVLVVQENVIRRRPDNDPWRDLNRFIDSGFAPRLCHEAVAGLDGRGLWSMSDAPAYPTFCLSYDNGEGNVSAIWVWRK